MAGPPLHTRGQLDPAIAGYDADPTLDAVYLGKRTLTPTLDEYVFRPPAPVDPSRPRGFWRVHVIPEP